MFISIFCVKQGYAQSDSVYFDQLKSKAESFYFTNPDSTSIYADSLFKLADAAGNVVFMGEGRRLKGVFHQLRAESDTAKLFFEGAATLFESSGDSIRFGRALLSIALMDISLGNYGDALDLLFRAKSISESQGVEQHTLRAIAEIGRVYGIQGDHDKALPQFQFYYSKVKDSQNLQQLATALNYLSVGFMQIHQHDSSLIYLNKNLKVQKELKYPIGIAAALQNIASVYRETHELGKALAHLKEANQYYTEANFSQGMGQVKLNIGDVYMEQRRFSEAAKSLKEAVDNSKIINDYHAMSAQFKLLAAAYDSMKNYDLALQNYRRFHAMSDTLLNIDKQRTLSELFAQYETKEKEQKIVIQNAQLGEQALKLERNQIVILGLIIIALLLISIVLLVRNRAKKKEALINKETELRLREAEISTIINSQEKERSRFARDLHDGFGQLISVLKLNLSQLNEVTNRDMEKRAEVFKNGESVINEMFEELRNICFDLMPQTLVKRGLTSALKELGARINRTKVNCEVLIFDNSERLPSLLEISLFRITQEWVNNILKYAEATNITIQMTREAHEVTLTIEDNGIGFDTLEFYSGKGNGWKNIQTRINQIGGDFDLDSQPKAKGSMVTINVAVQHMDLSTDKDWVSKELNDAIS